MKAMSFLRGMGAGMAAGAAVGALFMSRQGIMRTDVGRTMKRVGNAVDAAWYDIRQAMKD